MLVSIATAIELYVVKVGLFVLLAIFVSENAQFSAFFFKINPKRKQLFLVNANPFIITHLLLLNNTMAKKKNNKL